MNYRLENAGLVLDYTPETSSLTVTVVERAMTWSWTGGAAISLTDQTWLDFSSATCESAEFRAGVGVSKGIRATYTNFKDEAGKVYPFSVVTTLVVDETTGDVKTEATLKGDAFGQVAALIYPPRMQFDAKAGEGYTILPRMQGALIPAGEPIEPYHGLIYERHAYVPVFGQVKQGCGYTAIIDTPFDARYELMGEEIRPYFIPSLGYMSYARALRYSFFANGDFNTMAKCYRAYLAERGELVTLKEKIARNPKAEYLIGTPIVHTDTAVHIHPASHFYDKEHPERNDFHIPFAENARLLRELKQKGVEKLYLHLDGWGNHGYDNLHPDPFPVHEGAGGAEGMRALMETCHELGYYFGIHDQYRDYYYDAPSFDLENAVTNIDGSHPYHDYWFGGPHSFLCAQLAADFVRRNYNEFERLGIHLDGSYLDVFSVVELDECFHPNHPMTREQCAAARRHCLDILTDRGIVTSSEEVVGCIVSSQVLCHHTPFYTTGWEDPNAVNVGVPIPFLNLIYHDCVVIPWFGGMKDKGGWGIACTDRGFYWALLCGNTIYYNVHASEEDVEYGKIALELNRRVAFCELTSHELIDGHPRRRRSTFSDGTVVEADFDAETFCIRYPDGTVVEGN